MDTLRFFLKVVTLRFRAQIEYPGAYLTGIVAQWLSYGIEIFLIFVMVGRFGALGDWLPAEVVFQYAVWLLTYALGASFTFNLCMDFKRMGAEGLLDEALTRPVPTFAYLLATEYNLGYVSHVTLTLAVLVLSILRIGPHWTILEWVWLVVLILSGAAITGALMLLIDMPALRLRAQSPIHVFFWEGRQFSQYPISIYPRPLQLLFTSVLPFGFVGYYPLLTLLGKSDALFGRWMGYLSPLVAALLCALTAACWRRIVTRYESAGT